MRKKEGVELMEENLRASASSCKEEMGLSK